MEHADYAALVAAIRQGLIEYLSQVWEQVELGDAGLARLLELVVPVVRSAQSEVANLTSAYLAAATATRALPVDDSVFDGRGVDIEKVYSRPIVTTRAALSRGKSVDEAVRLGGKRLESIATTDVQMAKVRQADRSMTHSGQKFYRRVPEGVETCAMCLIASTQRYRVGTLLPIHGGCDCGVEPLPAGFDPNKQVIDEDLLAATHQRIKQVTDAVDRGGRNPDYRKLLVTQEHGELGPVLTWRHQKFTSFDDLK